MDILDEMLAKPSPVKAGGVTKSELQENFVLFLAVVWNYLWKNGAIISKDGKPTPSQVDIAKFLANGPKRRMIQAFRGVGKSWITAAYVVWRLWKEPHLNISVVSCDKTRADGFSIFVKQLITEIPFLEHLAPDRTQRSSNVAFDVGPAPAGQDPSVKSVGVFGRVVGSRADIVIADDIESPTNSETQLKREKLGEIIKQFAAILKPGGEIIYLGTPQTEESIYSVLPERGYQFKIWPAEVPTEEEIEIYNDRFSDYVYEQMELGAQTGDALDPLRFPKAELDSKKLEYGRNGYALQFKLNTRLSDADRYPLKISDFIINAVDPEVASEKIIWSSRPDLYLDDLPNLGFGGDKFFAPSEEVGQKIPYKGKVLAVDPSGRGKDETGYCVGMSLNSYIHIPEWGGLNDGYGIETLEFLANLAKRYKVNDIYIENNMGDGMFSSLLKPVLKRIYPCNIVEMRESVQKEARIIDRVEPILASHRFILDPKVISRDYESIKKYSLERQKYYSGIYQLSHLTKERGSLAQDDRVDVLSLMTHYFLDKISLDADVKMRARTDDLNDKMLKNLENSLNSVTLSTFGSKRTKRKKPKWQHRS